MAFTAQRHSFSPTSSLAFHTSVRSHPSISPLFPNLPFHMPKTNNHTVLISVIFSSIAYWLSNFQPTAQAFFTWVMWLFLDLVAAESLVVLMSSIFPNFVVSLALTAFANGLWMSVGGFLVPPTILNVFWKYVFHYIDYQSYVFQGMMVNEFKNRSYSCGDGCQCIYQSELASQCRISGTAVLDQYGYKTGKTGEWVGILLAIVLGYRLLGWVVLSLRK
jgi:ABC-2 type transporter